MNKNNIFLQIAIISLLGVSSTSFSMRKNSPLEDTKHVYKLFKVSQKDLDCYTKFQKLNPEKNLMFSKDVQEKLFVKTKSGDDDDDKKNFEEVTSFKFNKSGSILFCHYGNTAEIIDTKNNKSFKVGEALKFHEISTNNYEKYGFSFDNKYAFIIDTKNTHNAEFFAENQDIIEPELNTLNIIDLKTGSIIFSYKVNYNSLVLEECNEILSAFVSKQYKLVGLLYNILGITDEKLFEYKPENKL